MNLFSHLWEFFISPFLEMIVYDANYYSCKIPKSETEKNASKFGRPVLYTSKIILD